MASKVFSVIKSRFLLPAKVLFCVILLWILFSQMELSEFVKVLESMDYRFFLASLILLFLNTMISALKWRLLLKADGVLIPFSFLLQSYLIGTFMNIFLPSSIGGDVSRVYDVAKRSNSGIKSFASVFVDRASGLFAICFIGFMSSLINCSVLENQTLRVFLLSVFIMIFTAFVFLFMPKLHAYILKWIPWKRIRELFKKISDSFQSYCSGKLLLQILFISFCFQGMVVFIIFLYAKGLKLNASFVWFLMFVPVITLLESIPLTPFALGTRDWGYVFFFTQVGMKPEEAELLAITYVVMVLIYSLSGGILFVLRRNSEAKPQQEKRLEEATDQML